MKEHENLGFTYEAGSDDDVRIFRGSKVITVLRKEKAVQFLEDVSAISEAEAQQLMARVTGQYKHGNERQAKNHPRNRR